MIVNYKREFPVLQVVSFLEAKARQLGFDLWPRISIVAVQHLLETTGSLFKAICGLGISPDQIHVLGKHYSTNASVVDGLRIIGIHVHDSSESHRSGYFSLAFNGDVSRMWQAAMPTFKANKSELIIVLDDGGRCMQNMPPELVDLYNVIGIEQTTSGVRTHAARSPVIQVATSAAKKLLEPSIIAKTTFSKIYPYLPITPQHTCCGVIGMGSIGTAIADGLHDAGYAVVATDPDASKRKNVPYAKWCNDALDVLKEADQVYGCTGEDVFIKYKDFTSIHGKKTLFSVSSEDTEFNSLLRMESAKGEDSPRNDVFVSVPNGDLRIVNGGFPVNFDRSPVSAPSDAIQLTRGLLLAAVVQAAALHRVQSSDGYNSRLMLAPVMQRFVVKAWLDAGSSRQPSQLGWETKFADLSWVAGKSLGHQVLLPQIDIAFGK